MSNRNDFWRTLEEQAGTPEFQQLLQRKLPSHFLQAQDQDFPSGTNRRDFLKLMGATLVMAGLAGCQAEPPRETIVPYVNQPENLIPGKPLFFATAMPLNGYGIGILAENHMGRPTKLEGNPDHPATLGGSNALLQGSLLNLYDPDRAQVVTRLGGIETWENFLATLSAKLATLRTTGGAGLRILSETVTSPTLIAQLDQVLKLFPQARWTQYDAWGLDNVHAGTQLAFGRSVTPRYHFENVERILSLDADFLFNLPGSLRYARAFIDKRRLWSAQTPDKASMNRLYMLESSPTITGAKSDHRLPVRAGQIATYAQALARLLGITLPGASAELPQAHQDWLAAAARDLQGFPGNSLVIAGIEQPPAVHALAHTINATLNNIGHTVTYSDPVEAAPGDQLGGLRTLVQEMNAGQVDTLLILDANPVLTAPVDIDFAAGLSKVNYSVQLSLYQDETSDLCQWHVPAAHYLETWSDVRAYDGTASIIQPLIAPLFDGKSAHELLAALLGNSQLTSAYKIVRSTWSDFYTGLATPAQADFDSFFNKSLNDGVVAGTALPDVQVALADDWSSQLDQTPTPTTMAGLELIFRPDPSIGDGRFANNAWLQELPKHLSTLAWDNAALLSPATAARLQLNNQDMVELEFAGRTLTAPVWILPGHVDEAVTLYLGYGRAWRDKLSTGRGVNAYALRTAEWRWFGSGLTIRKQNGTYPLATTQAHFLLEGRNLVRTGTLEEYVTDPHFTADEQGEAETLYPGYQYEGHAWGMAIDLTACIGCNACTIACQVENNIPTVGKEEVLKGREMHWLKVDHYYQGEPDNPQSTFQPRPCMHCEAAPCELVCPVEATLHDAEGLNEMVYNRCVGTRYCSNNCPYQVRRFNFFNYADAHEIPLVEMARNPDVTVRARGVMEKCTYCIQRINNARIEAEQENRPIVDGEIQTACQTACPTRAIIFGDINDPNSQVAHLKGQPLNYGMLSELGTRPRTTYLAAVRNPNPEIVTT
ncbi:MAG: TAT-variant-translocated molybdopterin oxidoreductase [Caldilineaceae bacterium]